MKNKLIRIFNSFSGVSFFESIAGDSGEENAFPLGGGRTPDVPCPVGSGVMVSQYCVMCHFAVSLVSRGPPEGM